MSGDFKDLLRPSTPTLDDDALLAHVLDPGPWEGQLSLGTAADAPASLDSDALIDRIATQGWARVDDVLCASSLACVLDGIARVGQRGLPPVFAYLFPEVWTALAAPSLRGPVQALLPGAKQLPRSWITVVRPHEGAHGWEPHLDAARPAKRIGDDRFERLTLWIALTDATLDNGCMHLVPADRVPGPYTDLFEREHIGAARALAVLHAVQAAPCRAGSALLWRTDVIHFGGWANGEGLEGRVAVALHLVHGRARVPTREQPTRDLFEGPPAHAGRAAFVARQLLAYASYERQLPALMRWAPFAKRVLARS